MNLNELSAEQIVFLSTINDTLVETYERVIRDKGITRSIEIPMIGSVKSFHSVSEEEIAEITVNKRYICAKSVQDKLKPIADFIKDATPDIYEKAYSLAGMHDDEEESKDSDDNS
jgi:hypothetical protein